MTEIFTGIFAGVSTAPQHLNAAFLNIRADNTLVTLLEAGCTLIQSVTKSGEIIGFSLLGFSKNDDEICGEVLFTSTWKNSQNKIFASLWEASRLYSLEQGAKRMCLWIPHKGQETGVDFNKVTLLNGKTIAVCASGIMCNLSVEPAIPWKKQWLYIAKKHKENYEKN